PLLALRRERRGRWIAEPGDCRRRPSDPPAATHEPKRVPALRIQPAPPEQQDYSPHAGAADAVGRVAVALCPHRLPPKTVCEPASAWRDRSRGLEPNP